jgi:NAD(P)-dependent dehydrogenase (short-subunit alcohol dehydrogenase family)
MTTVSVQPALLGQTVVVIGGSAGIGLETARRARSEGAELILTGRDPGRLDHAAADLHAHASAAFDANDQAALARFFDGLSGPIDHVLVTAGSPRYGRMLEMTDDEAREALSDHMLLSIQVARHVARTVRPAGSLLLVGGTGGRHITIGNGIAAAVTAALPALTASLALELAPVRVNLIAPGFVDTPLSAAILGEGLEARREELRRKLPIGRVVEPADVGALAVHLMTNTAITGATYDVDGGQQLVA